MAPKSTKAGKPSVEPDTVKRYWDDIAETLAERSHDECRPVCDELSEAMLKALRGGSTRSGGAAAGLKARRLWCPGALRGNRFAPTPMGEQWRRCLIELERKTRALKTLRGMLGDGSSPADMLEVIAGALT